MERTISGKQADLTNKEKVVSKLQRELDELKFLRGERDQMKQQMCRIEEDYKALETKRLHDLNALKEAHQHEVSTYMSSVTPLREQLELQKVSISTLQSQLNSVKEELQVATVERDHFKEQLSQMGNQRPTRMQVDAGQIEALQRKIYKMDDIVIGIDLGTTNSRISLHMNGSTRILENEFGARFTPSFIYFRPEGGFVIGQYAKKMAAKKPENGIYEMKRLVGRKYDDLQLQKSLKNFDFNVSKDFLNLPVISVRQKGTVFKKTPQELYTILLRELKRQTEEKLKQGVDKLVLTVPAYFNVAQREITLAAAKDAGFTVLKLLNEPTAAALAYYFDVDIEKTHYSLVYDLGGSTFDVSIVEKRSDSLDVLAVSGDTQLGGHCFDHCVLDYVVQLLQYTYKYDPKSNPDDKRKLRNNCEEAKKELSFAEETGITISEMVPGHPNINISITRSQFETLTKELFQRTIDIVDNCLQSSNISKQSIQEVLLCGGSTHIPKIQEMVSLYFGKEKLTKFVSPDECVAQGAALQAAMLSTHSRQNIKNVVSISLDCQRTRNGSRKSRQGSNKAM